MITASQFRVKATFSIAYMILFAFLGIYSCASKADELVTTQGPLKISISAQGISSPVLQQRKR